MRPKAPKTLLKAEHRRFIAVLIAARRRAKLTQRRLADLLGWPYAVVARIESGARRMDVIEFDCYARALGEKPTKLYERALKR